MKKQILLFMALIMSIVASAQVTIQMEKDGGVYKVPCTVNGVKMKFIFDTGASTVCISQSMAQFLLDGDYLSVDDIVGTGQSQVADGSIVNHVEIILRDIEIGGMHIHNIEATVIEGQNAPLLLGQTAIGELGRISIEGDKLLIHAADNGLSQEQIDQLGEQAERYLQTGSYAAAIENLNTIDEAIGLTDNRLIGLCYSYYQNKQYNECIQSCKRWINEYQKTSKKDGNKVGAFYYMALSYYWGEHDYNNAMLYFQKTIDVFENGNLISQSSDDEIGMFSFKNNMELTEWKSSVNFYVGSCFSSLENYSKAIPFYRSAIVLRCKSLNMSLESVKKGQTQDEALGYYLYELAFCHFKLNYDRLNNNAEVEALLKLSALCGNNTAVEMCRIRNLNYRKKIKYSFEWWND